MNPVPPSTTRRVLLDRRTAVRFLLELGLLDRAQVVDDGVEAREIPRRNRNVAVRVRNSRGFLLKQPVDPMATDDVYRIERERTFHQLAAGNSRLETVLPPYLAYDATQRILVLELLSPSTPLDEFCFQREELVQDLAAPLGSALGLLHDAAGKAWRFEASELGLPGRVPSAFRIVEARRQPVEGAQAAILDMIRSFDAFPDLLREARTMWSINVVMHGDLKLGNCLHTPERTKGPLCIVDWETADAGDAAWDMGGLFQSIVALWIQSMPPVGADRIEEGVAQAKISTSNLQAFASRLWDSYRDVLGVPEGGCGALLKRAVRFAGARLLQTAFEHAAARPRVTRHGVLYLQAAANLLEQPDEAARDLFGIVEERS